MINLSCNIYRCGPNENYDLSDEALKDTNKLRKNIEPWLTAVFQSDVSPCSSNPFLQEPVKGPARLEWHEVKKLAHYYLTVDAVTRPMMVREDEAF